MRSSMCDALQNPDSDAIVAIVSVVLRSGMDDPERMEQRHVCAPGNSARREVRLQS